MLAYFVTNIQTFKFKKSIIFTYICIGNSSSSSGL